MHDFVDPELGKVIPTASARPPIKDGLVLALNMTPLNLQSSQFGIGKEMGKRLYPRTKHLLITADCGGSNGNRIRLWKLKLQELADETSLTFSVILDCKWNKIEHRMLSYFSKLERETF